MPKKKQKNGHQNLKKRGETWYARLRVPTDVVGIVGKSELVQSLRTSSLTTAKRKLPQVLSAWHDQFDTARAANGYSPLVPSDPILAAATELRAKIASNRSDPETASEVLGSVVDKHLKARFPFDPETGHYEADEATIERIRQAFELVDDHSSTLLSEALTDYLRENEGRVRKQTLNTQKRRIEALMEWLGGDRKVSAVTRLKAGQYITQVVAPMDRSVKTKKDTISYLSTFFSWCEPRLNLGQNPFLGLGKTIKDTKRATKAKTARKRQPWSTDELTTLFSQAETASSYWLMSVLALYTGMRANEIAETVKKDVHDGYIHIPEAKSESGQRDVPLHPVIKPLVHWLRDTAEGDYLVSELKRGGEDDKRSHYFVKYFTAYRRRLGIDRSGVVFHSLRHTFITAAENARLAENVINQLVGHQKSTISLSTYSAGIDELSSDMAKIKFRKVDPLVRRLVKKIVS